MRTSFGFSILVALTKGQDIFEASTSCDSSIITWSNRQNSNPCTGNEGDECEYTCYDGHVAIGRHVCQSYTTKSGEVAIDKKFFGGRCQRLCSSDEPCASGTVPVRWNSTDSTGDCFQTTCLKEDEALRRLAKGNYGLWRLGRNSATGIYTGGVNPSVDAESQSSQAHIGINGVALMMECVAVEMGWTTVADAQARVNQTMSSLAGKTPGFVLPRNKRGWIPTFFNRDTGKSGATKYTVLDTGLNAAGVLFAQRYFSQKHPKAQLTDSIASLANEIFNAVQWETILCNSQKKMDLNGDEIPFTFDDDDNCDGLHKVASDGFYGFSELHYAVWLAYENSCAGYAAGECPNQALDAMWQAWQGRRNHPNIDYQGMPLLSLWSSYIVHLPYYSSHSFNADPVWQSLFKSHWQADLAYYSSDKFYAGDAGRYGIAAGFTDKWCSAKDTGYEADMLVKGDAQGAQGCRIYSPYAVAGYLPAESDTIKTHLLDLLAAGESVFPLRDGSGDYVMLRKSLLEPGWNQNDHVSMVDFSSELFGLSTIWLGAEFWQEYTNHFGESAADLVV